jgi:diguanylate cyclase (GGDEF)-like protein
VGRLPTADLCLRDTGVSRQHARFVWKGETYGLQDSGSGNGTYVNGRRVTEQTLADGDVVQFGPNAVFRYAVTDENQEAMLQHLYRTSVSDPLTGACNREHLDMRLAEEVSYARRHGVELGLVLFDIDHFKRVNDQFGHQAGDQVLVTLVSQVAEQIRGEDLLGRYGGEEFAVVLRTTGLLRTVHVAERIRQTAERMRVPHGDTALQVTVSAGCATLSCCSEPSAEQMVAVADRRLYAAKRAGRNRVAGTD